MPYFQTYALYLHPDCGRIQCVLHEKAVQERKRLGISQAAFARSAGVPRSQLAIFETGGSVTLSTLRRIVEHLPSLRLDLIPAEIDLDEALRAAIELENLTRAASDAASRLVAALGRTMPAIPDEPARDETHPDYPLLMRLERIAEQLEREGHERRREIAEAERLPKQ
jgi:transcriptional regulator with XRE-family HTH domain